MHTNLTKYKWKSLYCFQKSIPRVHDNQLLNQDGLPFKVRVKSQKEFLRSHLPKLPDKTTSSHKLSDLPNDIQQL